MTWQGTQDFHPRERSWICTVRMLPGWSILLFLSAFLWMLLRMPALQLQPHRRPASLRSNTTHNAVCMRPLPRLLGRARRYLHVVSHSCVCAHALFFWLYPSRARCQFQATPNTTRSVCLHVCGSAYAIATTNRRTCHSGTRNRTVTKDMPVKTQQYLRVTLPYTHLASAFHPRGKGT